MVWFLSAVIFIICYFNYRKLKKLSQYIIFLEDEYYNLIKILIKSNDKEREKLLSKATKTSLFKKIRYSKADNFEKFRIMHEENNFSYLER